MNIRSTAEERHKTVHSEGNTGSGTDFRQQRKKLLVNRIIALAERLTLSLRRGESAALLRFVAKLGKAVRELHPLPVEFPSLRDAVC